ncbi:RAMP superfamily CRISPR-associated protein [Myxococcota bacterium]|nr:RAMP superfamily CRISPR-associated protein [Myxococcota bacterium]
MNTREGTLRVLFSGPLLVGGHTHAGGSLDAATARHRKHEDRPIIPASALKGALREAVFRLNPGCCLPWTPCKGTDRCLVCAIFGPSGVDRPGVVDDGESADAGWLGAGLRVGDAVAAERVSYQVRHGVSIDRFTGAKVDGRLFRREVAAPRRDEVLFEAPLQVRLNEDQLARLREASAVVDGIGNSQSRGMGRIRLEIVLQDTSKKNPPSVEININNPGDALVEVEALEPLHLGGLPDGGNVKASERVIPGAALLGALVAAARRAGIDKDQAGRLFGLALSASDLLPAKSGSGAFPAPIPRTALHCPTCGHTRDYLVVELAARALAERGLDVGPPPTCPVCRARSDSDVTLKPLSGAVWPQVEIASRVVTRLARDPATRSAAPGLLHLREQLEPDGVVFRGTLSGLNAESLALLQRIAREPLFIGGARSRGLGRARVRLLSLPRDFDPKRRIESFRTTARVLAPLWSFLGWDADRLLPVLVRTPLDLGDPGQAPGALGQQLFGGDASLLGCWQRTTWRAGWDDWAGAPLPLRPVVAPGSVYLFSAPSFDPQHLRQAEIAGIGDHTRLGLGRLYFGSPLSIFQGA